METSREHIDALRDIPIGEFLASRGFEPAHFHRGDMWYHSPLREGDKKPSFVVHRDSNRWWDFSEGRGGDIFDLVKGLSGNPSMGFGEVCRVLEAYDPMRAQGVSPVPARRVEIEPREPSLAVESVGAVSDMYSLADYLSEERKLNPSVAERHGLRVVFYRNQEGKRRFALGFPNDEGGYELRCAYFKGTLGKKSLSCSDMTLRPDTLSHINVFEGFLDYLSYAELNPNDNSKYIILNSTALADKAVVKLRTMADAFEQAGFPNTSIRLYLDKDEAGNRATQIIEEAFRDDRRVGMYDMRAEFPNANDINEYLQNLRRAQQPKLSKPILKKPSLKL